MLFYFWISQRLYYANALFLAEGNVYPVSKFMVHTFLIVYLSCGTGGPWNTLWEACWFYDFLYSDVTSTFTRPQCTDINYLICTFHFQVKNSAQFLLSCNQNNFQHVMYLNIWLPSKNSLIRVSLPGSLQGGTRGPLTNLLLITLIFSSFGSQ